MKANSDKFHLLLTGIDSKGTEVLNEKIGKSFCETLL